MSELQYMFRVGNRVSLSKIVRNVFIADKKKVTCVLENSTSFDTMGTHVTVTFNEIDRE